MKFYMAHDERGTPKKTIDRMTADEARTELSNEIVVGSPGMTAEGVREQLRIQLLIIELGL